MPWKTEIDRLVHHLALDAPDGGEGSARRAIRTVADLVQLAPGRPANHFHAGVLEEVLGAASPPEEIGALLAELDAPEAEADHRWRHLGHLDGASRRGDRERVHGLMEDPLFEASLDHDEGRIALRAVGRMLLREGQEELAFDLYRRHLAAVKDEGSRRDAEFLLEESLRRADRSDGGEEETLARLDRAAAFAEESGLDERARSKVDRKLGRLHQLAARWDDATGCYRRALDRLPDDDPYRSVLVGDLTLATLGVRGTLDLLPTPEREGREAAEEILRTESGGEGRSYNAIYTRGMLAYERGDYDAAAEGFAEADQLMRENRAKARIVHARSRFFLAHCRLEQGAEGEALDDVQQAIQRNASAVSLDPEVKGPVFDALVERKPDARIPGRQGQRGGRGGGGGARASAAEHLEEARKVLESDPHAALDRVDRAFKSRPDFDAWNLAYRTRLDALLALDEQREALRTYERYRAKLYQREAFEALSQFLTADDSVAPRLLGDVTHQEEMVDLFEVMPESEDKYVASCVGCARTLIEAGEPLDLARAVALLEEARAHDEKAVSDLLGEATEKARAASALPEEVSGDEIRELLKGEEEPVRLVVVGGDTSRQPHHDQFDAYAKEMGFEGEWIVTGVRPPYKTLRDIASAAQDSDVLLLHHALGEDLRQEVRAIAEKYDVAVHEAAWIGRAGLEREVLQGLKEAFE